MASQAANLWVLLGLGLAGIFIITKNHLKKVIKVDFGAFIRRLELLPPPQPLPPKAPHPLTSLSFVISDIFDIYGYVTGFGNPDWARTHEVASSTSPVVSSLVQGGATCTGTTVLDDMAASTSGENKHYDMPSNPAAPGRIPGGPSSGSAVAVAAKIADFSLGIDTVGGVRIPAAYCGVLGFRPSHGTVPHIGIIPVATSLDTVGWFAKDSSVLRRVGHVLLQVPFVPQRNPRNIFIADDCFQLSKIPSDRVTQAVIKSTEKLFGRQALKHENLGAYVDSKVPSLKLFTKSNGEVKSFSLGLLGHVMQQVHRNELKNNHEKWVNSVKPTVNPAIAALMQQELEISENEIQNCDTVRHELRSALNFLLKEDGILVIPTVANPPPKIGSKEISSEDYLTRTSTLMSLASMSGCCQVTVPLGFHEKSPISVSFIARYGGDRFLLDTVHTMYATLQEQADLAGKSKVTKEVVSKETYAEIAKEKGNQAYKEKQWQKAIGFYTEAIKLNGNIATYYTNRAACHLELGSFIQAEDDCTKAISIEKKNVKAYFRRGTAREMLGYYKEAIEDFKYALILEPTNKQAATCLERLQKLFQ
jgi:Asp-tRNA(Asn)/Glu-tRNA(Gln) amidotransferase A subunit family amidase